MADIRPFQALRYNLSRAGDISSLVCPPYDIIGEEEHRALLDASPYNMVRLELPQGEQPYAQAAQTLSSWKEEGVLEYDMDPGLYLYEEEFLDGVTQGETRRLRTLIGQVRLEDFSAGVILPHEETLSKAKEDRFQLMEATGCNFSQIYCLYEDRGNVTRERLSRLAQALPPRYQFSYGRVTHRLWVINDPVTIAALREDFAPRKLYIADGHHRYETALRYRDAMEEQGLYRPGSGFVMMALAAMDDPGLVVHPTHRLLRGLSAFSGEALLKSCEPWFVVTLQGSLEETQEALNAGYREGVHRVGFYDGRFHTLTLRDASPLEERLPEKSPAYRNLDVTVLHSLILEELLAIDRENMAAQKNLTYTRSAQEAVESVDKGESQCCFLLNPTRVEEISQVAAAGEKMPQKSTYFYPKLITGLTMNDLCL